MSKKLNIVIYILSGLYFLLNFSKITSAFQSSLWSREMDLINHVSNYNFQLQAISLIILFIAGNLAMSHGMGLNLSKWILIPIAIVMSVLLINTQIDFIRWIEINVFGGGFLLVLAVIFILSFAYQAYRNKKNLKVP